MKEELEVAFSWFSILTAAAYTFTLGYLDVLKIPISPSPLETLLFYLRATLIGSNIIWSAFVIFFPLIIAYIFIRVARNLFSGPKKAQPLYKRLSKEVLVFLAGIVLITLWCTWTFNQGRISLASKKASNFFPEAYMNSKHEKLLKLAWIDEGNFFWLDCDEAQPELIGVKDDTKFYIRRLGANASSSVCSKGE